MDMSGTTPYERLAAAYCHCGFLRLCCICDEHVAWHGMAMGTEGGRGEAHPFVVIGKAGPVQHVHHGLEAEDGRLAELAVVWHCQRLGC